MNIGDKVIFENEPFTVKIIKCNKALIEPIYESNNNVIRPSWEEVDIADLK